jgi:hypothetical protein
VHGHGLIDFPPSCHALKSNLLGHSTLASYSSIYLFCVLSPPIYLYLIISPLHCPLTDNPSSLPQPSPPPLPSPCDFPYQSWPLSMVHLSLRIPPHSGRLRMERFTISTDLAWHSNPLHPSSPSIRHLHHQAMSHRSSGQRNLTRSTATSIYRGCVPDS